MNKRLLSLAALGTLLLIAVVYYYVAVPPQASSAIFASEAMAAQFDRLSTDGNSNCSDQFTQSIKDGTIAAERIQGSCCSPMDPHRYQEQVEGLKRFSDIPEIPTDPYDIPTTLARELMSYYDTPLTEAGQQAYDYAMKYSMGGGPCCCMCWGWYVYGGLAKKLITERGFTGAQITELWDLSDMCGGPGEHLTHT